MVRAKASALPPSSISNTASAISSDAWAERICAPSTRPARLVGDDLGQAVRMPAGDGPAVGLERKNTHGSLVPIRLGPGLGEAHGGHFRRGVNDRRDGVVIHAARLPAMRSTAATASCSALCASIGPATTSPMA